MRIAVDAMGGDRGPLTVLEGVLEAARQSESHFYIVGDPAILEPEFAKVQPCPKNVELIPALQVIGMDENPVEAYRKKPNASVIIATQMVKDQKADGLVTIANTGAAVTVALLMLRRIRGIDRPAIATPMPSLTGTVILLDAGATPDCDSNNLFEFALMGSAYSQSVIGIQRPRVGLLNIGEEENKGNALVKRALTLFRQELPENLPYEFVGNIEGKDIYSGKVDVVVCDGFVGNAILKTSEGVADMIQRVLKEELTRNKLLTPVLMLLKPAFRRLRKRIDYSEYGGAPLLGINGVCIIGHGRSNANAVKNACAAAEKAIKHNLVEIISKRAGENESPPPPL